jgi:hypothetical protein
MPLWRLTNGMEAPSVQAASLRALHRFAAPFTHIVMRKRYLN